MLDLDEVAIGVAQEAMIDVVFGIEGGRLVKGDTLVAEVAKPLVHLGCDEG